MKKILLILIPLVLILVLAGGGLIVYFQVLAHESPDPAVEKVGPIYETEEFTVNTAQSANRYIKAQFALELTNEKVRKELDDKLPLLQDRVIMVLSAQRMDELSTSEGKEALKKSLIEAINKFLEKGQVTKIYFKNIIFS